MRIRISVAVIAAAFAGSVGGAAAQYYPPPPYGYPAYPAPAYSQAPLPPPNYGPPPADPSYQPQAPYGGGPYQRYAPPPDRMSSAGEELPPQPMPPGLAGEPFQRPPAGIVADPNDTTGALPPAAPVARPNSAAAVAALPPEDQPEQGPPKQLPPQFRRQMVDYVTSEPPGTIVVDTPNTYLYMVLGNGKAMRYGIGVGREGFTWTGTERVTRMKEWPDWFPPKEMIDRQPYLPRFMAGGETNPLGARALYLGNTLYRIHGTNQPSTIGTFVSSGCIRLTNDDIADLYSRVNVGTRVVVMPGAYPVSAAAQHSVAQ